MKNMIYLLTLLALFQSLGYAHTGKDCQKILVGNIEIIPSGRGSREEFELLVKYANLIFPKDGVANKLGISLPPQFIEFSPSADLSVLATLGRHAIPHWRDGSIIATQSGGAAGVLEFVTPGGGGCTTCRSFYSDTTKVLHQVSVLTHVVGHNDFSVHSMFNRIRPSDPIASSIKLHDLVEKLYEKYDHDEVSQWYQFLESLKYMQDISRGTFDSPESFEAQKNKISSQNPERISHSKEFLNNSYPSKIFPKNPTPSVLQAFVATLSEDLPPWKKEMAKLYEEMNRVYGYYATTKIMNEGWATFMMELLVHHMPEESELRSTMYSLEHANLLSGVAYPSLTNPYWLGRECWRNVYRRFNERPEIAKLGNDRLEKDRRFVKMAHNLIAQKGDYDFIRYALDEKWIHDKNLFLYRKLTDEESWIPNPNRPRPPADLENPELKKVLSRDPKRIINSIAKSVADRSSLMPNIVLENVHAFGRNVISYNHVLHPELSVPLEKKSMAQTLFVLSRAYEKPVSLKTFFIEKSFPKEWRDRTPPTITKHFVRIEVEPNGKIRFFDPNDKEGSEINMQAAGQSMQDAIYMYKEDLDTSSNADLVARQDEKFSPQMIKQIVSNNLQGSVEMASHSPTAARALSEYSSMIERRMQLILERLVQGKINPKILGKKVRIKVLPDIPEFSLDYAELEFIREFLPPSPVDVLLPPMVTSAVGKGETLPLIDRDSDIGVGNPGPGDEVWGEGRPKNGEGDGEDGEPGTEPGHGEDRDPSEIDISLEDYTKLLQNELELPNLRPKPGLDEKVDDAREGGIHRPFGNILRSRMAGKTIALGQIALKRENGKKPFNPKQVNRNKVYEKGVKYIQPSDHIVSDREVTPVPEMNAVVAIYMDMTGSMSGEPIKRAKEMTFNLKMLLAGKYKHLEFRYIGFSDTAKEFPEKTFFKSFIGGGTYYGSGLKMTKEILEQYPDSRWDRFSFGIGDAQDDGDQVEAEGLLRDINEITQYSAFVHTSYSMQGQDDIFVTTVKKVAADDPFFDWARTDQTQESSMNALKKLFGKNKPPKE